jgi:hypothetical protein
MRIKDVPIGGCFWFCGGVPDTIYVRLGFNTFWDLRAFEEVSFNQDAAITALAGQIGCVADGVTRTFRLGDDL